MQPSDHYGDAGARPDSRSYHADLRREARNHFKPSVLDTLFVAEAPPSDDRRYFYFEDVVTQDGLFIELMKFFYGDAFESYVGARTPEKKYQWLARFQADGLWLLDAYDEPMIGAPSSGPRRASWLEDRSDLSERLHNLSRDGYISNDTPIILIKVTVYDALFQELTNHYNVIDKRIPFPGSGQQASFHDLLRDALTER